MIKRSTIFMLLFVLVSSARAENWPQWRGPNFNGTTDETNLPTEFGQTDNVVWSADLPGPGASTPVVWDDRVFISGVDSPKATLQAMCLDRTNGKVLWQHEVGEGINKDYRSNFAAPSAVTDGEIVIFFYGNGDLICYDMDGEQQWARNIQKDEGTFAFLWTFSSSPTLFEGKLYMQVLQRDVPVDGRGFSDRVNESYLLIIDPETGKTLKRHVRPSKARAESRESFTTPMPYEHDGKTQLLVVGGDAVSGHDLETLDEIWRWGTWNPERIGHWRHVTSPIAGGGVVLACAPKKDPVYAVKLGGTGVVDDGALAWVSRDDKLVSSDVPTPAFYDGDFFVLNGLRYALSRVDPGTGKVKWSVATSRVKYEASPLAADGKIYVMDHDGLVTIYKAEDGEVINRISMDDPQNGEMVRASISAAHGQLFIRTTSKLFCVGEGG